MDSRHQDIQKLIVEKAMDANGSAALLNPQFLSDVVAEVVQYEPALFNLLPKFDMPGGVYGYDTWDIQKGNSNLPQGAAVADSATFSFSGTDPVITKTLINASIIAAVFQISKYEIAASAKLLSLLTRRVESGVQDFHRREELVLLAGDSNNPTQPGLLATLTASGNISAGTTAAPASSTLSYQLFNNMEAGQSDLNYDVSVWFVTKNINTILRGASFNRNRWLNLNEMAIGYSQNYRRQQLTLNGIPVIPVHSLYAAAGNQDTILGLNLNEDAIGVGQLKPASVEETGVLPTAPLVRSFVVSAFQALAVPQPYKHCIAQNVSLSGVTSSNFD